MLLSRLCLCRCMLTNRAVGKGVHTCMYPGIWVLLHPGEKAIGVLSSTACLPVVNGGRSDMTHQQLTLYRPVSTDSLQRSQRFLQKQVLHGHLTGHILQYVRQGFYVQMTCPETAPGWLQMSLVWGPLQKGVSAQHLAACFQLPPVPDMHPYLQQSACVIQWMRLMQC